MAGGVIFSGVGTPHPMEVKSNYRGQVDSVCENALHHYSEHDEEAYAWSNVTYDYDAADTVILIKNTSATKKLHFTYAHIGGDTATEVQIHLCTCASPTGTAITGVNLNRTSDNVAPATAIGDETTNTQGDIVWHGLIVAATSLMNIELDGVILGQNQCLGIDFVTNGAACYATVHGYFK